MAMKEERRAGIKEMVKTLDKVDHSKTKPDEIIDMHYKRWIYKEVPMTHEYWKKKIVDLGCDIGHTFSSVKKDNITHVDFVDRDVENFVKADLEEVLPFDDNQFDVVVLTEVLEHVIDPVFTLNEAIRVSNDKIIISVPHEHMWSKNVDPFTHCEHMHYFTYDTFRKLIDDTGLPYEKLLECFQTDHSVDYIAWMCATLRKR